MNLEFVQNYLQQNVFDLNSTQRRLSLPILQRIRNKLEKGESFRALSVDGTDIVNGHHRYVCMHILGIKAETIPWQRSPSSQVISWNEVEIDTLDWDNPPPIIKKKVVPANVIEAH